MSIARNTFQNHRKSGLIAAHSLVHSSLHNKQIIIWLKTINFQPNRTKYLNRMECGSLLKSQSDKKQMKMPYNIKTTGDWDFGGKDAAVG